MQILIPLKQILDPSGFTVNRKAGKVFVNEENYIVNPADKRALEAALKVKDSHGASVIAVSLGPERAEAALREALAMGADRAILFTGEPFEKTDDAGVVKVLAALVHTLDDAQLLFLGDAALDTGGAQVGPRLAQNLDWAFLGPAVSASLDGNAIRVVRSEARQYVGYEADLPAVVTFSREAARPRYPTAQSLITNYQSPTAVERWTLTDLGLTEANLQSLISTLGESFPPERELGRQLEGTVEEIAAGLAKEI